MAKLDYRRDIWERLCGFVESDDGWPTYKCGVWTIRKLYFLGHYLAITSHAMAGSRNFTSINYIDLFCGPGVDEVDGGRRYPGSPLLAAACRKPFTKILLADEDSTTVDASVDRIRRLGARSHIESWVGDANSLAPIIASAIPDRSLNILFADPYTIGALKFDTLSTLSERGAVDLLVLFADRMDVGRNLETYHVGRSNKLDDFLGPDSGWRQQYDKLQNREPNRVRQMLSNVYLAQLRKLGYNFARTMEIPGDKGPLYRLVYASKNQLGLKFWDIAAGYDFDGSRSLWGI